MMTSFEFIIWPNISWFQSSPFYLVYRTTVRCQLILLDITERINTPIILNLPADATNWRDAIAFARYRPRSATSVRWTCSTTIGRTASEREPVIEVHCGQQLGASLHLSVTSPRTKDSQTSDLIAFRLHVSNKKRDSRWIILVTFAREAKHWQFDTKLDTLTITITMLSRRK